MRSGVAPKKAPAGFPNRSIQARLVRLVRMAVAFLVVAGSLGLATVTATAQSTASSCPTAGADAYADLTTKPTTPTTTAVASKNSTYPRRATTTGPMTL